MKKMKKLFPHLIPICIGVSLFLYIKEPEAGFNIIPYAIFLLFSNNAAATGGESNFIIIFDLLFSIAIGYFLYKILNNVFNNLKSKKY
jgi:hypothetical protein